MNKLFSKIAALSVGLAMAVGVGVALGRQGKLFKIEATPAVAASCDFTLKTASCTGYSKEHTYGDYKVYGGQNNGGGWAYFKFGAKKAGSSDPAKVTNGYIKGTTALTQDISKVQIATQACTTGTVTVDASLLVATDAGFSNVVDTVSITNFDRTKTATVEVAPSNGTSWGTGKYFQVKLDITNDSTTNGVVFVDKVNFIYESSTPRGEIEINDLSSRVLTVGSNGSLSYSWTPASGSSSTIASHSWTSSNTDVATVSGDTYTAVAPGTVTFTLEATDSVSEEYSVTSIVYYVTKTYSFVIGDNVAIYSDGVTRELSGVNKDSSTHYGTGEEYSGDPVGVYLLNVEAGSEAGSYSFVNDGNYLAWSSGNSLTTKTSKDANSSWFVVQHDDYAVISNAAQLSREIWWNDGSSGKRFACYEGKTPESSGYNSVNLVVIADVPVRGTVAITAPTDTLVRQGAVGTARFSWTPAEESEATISSHTWSSSNAEVISVSGDTYTAVAPGKAKLTLNATDSTGQNYVVSTSDITVVEVVSGSYVKKTSVAAGDTVVLACESAGTQLSGISSNIGTYVFYNNAPADVYSFELETASDGYFAFKTSDDKYLAWKAADTKFELVDEITENASWSISFDAEGNAIIANKGLDGDDHRVIRWNNGSPRFAPYKSGQTPVQLYGAGVVYTAEAFAGELLDLTDAVCSEWKEGDDFHDEIEAIWTTMSGLSKYGALSSAEKLLLVEAERDEKGSTIEQAMARYDYLTGRYNLDNFITGRTPASSNYSFVPEMNNNSYIIIIVISSVSVLSFGLALFLRKKRSK